MDRSAAAIQRGLMKAIVCRTHGRPDVLKLEEIDKPSVPDDGLLVRVHASSINPVGVGAGKASRATGSASRASGGMATSRGRLGRARSRTMPPRTDSRPKAATIVGGSIRFYGL